MSDRFFSPWADASPLIVVNVSMDTAAQVQGALLAHQCEGLIKRSKLRSALDEKIHAVFCGQQGAADSTIGQFHRLLGVAPDQVGAGTEAGKGS
jgi:hypothetical protein